MAVVVLLTALLAFSSNDSNIVKAGEQLVKKDMKKDIAPSQSQPKKSKNNTDSIRDIKLTESQRKMSDNINDFACNLFRTIYKQEGSKKSIILSPISVGYLLGMLNEGADGETRQQITNVLRLDCSFEEINNYFQKMMDVVALVDTAVTVNIANCIEINSAKGISLIPQYQADMQKYYDAQVDALDFSDGRNLKVINNWCKSHTNGMIPTILTPDEFQPDAAMYLLDAIYFQAPWTKKFDPEETRKMVFTKQGGRTVKRNMMHLKRSAAYGKNDLCKMLCLSYGNYSYSMYVLLPHKGKTINDIIQSLSARNLEEYRKREMISREVDILLPRFTTENETNLKGALSSMGMPRIFGSGAEFPNMAQGHKDLYVSKIKQKARIEAEEEGTKAAAVTIAEVFTLCAKLNEEKPKIVEFHATRPFVYYIVENSTHSILFMGTYCGD